MYRVLGTVPWDLPHSKHSIHDGDNMDLVKYRNLKCLGVLSICSSVNDIIL